MFESVLGGVYFRADVSVVWFLCREICWLFGAVLSMSGIILIGTSVVGFIFKASPWFELGWRSWWRANLMSNCVITVGLSVPIFLLGEVGWEVSRLLTLSMEVVYFWWVLTVVPYFLLAPAWYFIISQAF